MDEKNRFLDAYKKKVTENEDTLKFEQKSDFKKPKKIDDGPKFTPSKNMKRAVIIATSSIVVMALIISLALFLNRGVEVMNFTDWTENDVKLWARDSGVILQIEKEYNDEIEAGKVISQELSEGERIKKGQFMGLVISQGHDMSVALPLPDLLNMTKSEIEDWAEENFMDKVRITAEFSSNIPIGNVIRYEINDDTVVDKVKRSTPIYVIVSKGPEDDVLDIVVPNFKEMGIAESYVFARENGIELIVEEEYDDYVPEGMTISQSIEPEEKVAKDSEIILVVSKGKLITVPDFSGSSQEKATAMAAESGISLIINEKYSSQPKDAFISQSIKAGEEYEKGDIVELTYSLGNRVVLPSFVGGTRDNIEEWAKALNEQGASISIKSTNTSSNQPRGTILFQDKESTLVGISTSINITVSSGRVIFVPDFVAP
ncbi:MAG: PASTA domain-containing protein, partial [Clostridiales bacterium]|nr:PASTA domain-containing protein [Clostridiales bacterium]